MPRSPRKSARLALGLAIALSGVLLTPAAAHAGARTADGVACTIVGTKGKDVLRGTARRDVICGRGGNDVIKGGRGHDVIDGGPGDDRLSGGSGKDRIVGGKGADVLNGGQSNDFLDGGDGADRLSGGSGKDKLTARRGNDVLAGGAGRDRLIGGGDQDRMVGGSGNDWLAGRSGADSMDGGSGADRLLGEHGDDVMTGATGDDLVSGGTGDDTVTGATGDDDLSGDSGDDSLDGGSGFNLCDVPGAGDEQLRCAIDEERPVLGAVTSSAARVDVSNAPGVVEVTARVSDDTGVKRVQIGPALADRISGTRRNGLWRVSLIVPRFIVPGPRDVHIVVGDRVGRVQQGTRDRVYTIVNTSVDREMPVLRSLSLSSNRVDVRSSGRSVAAKIVVTDDLAGPTELRVCASRANSPGISFGAGSDCNFMRRTSGGPKSSTWQGRFTIPKGSVGGTWNASVQMGDAAGNHESEVWLGPHAFAGSDHDGVPGYRPIPGGAGVLTVLGALPDTELPELTSVTLSPSRVDTSRGAVRVTAEISGTDDQGITEPHLGISGRPKGSGEPIDIAWVADFQRVSGTARNGTWRATFVVPGGTPDGSYSIYARLSDRTSYTSWASPGTGSYGGTLNSTNAPTGTKFVVENLP